MFFKNWTFYLYEALEQTSLVPQTVKHLAYNAGDLGSIPGSRKILWRRKWQPTPVLLPGKSHGPRSLVGYSPLGHKESDMTELLHFSSLLLEQTKIIHDDGNQN